MRWTAEGDSLMSMREVGEQQPDPEQGRRAPAHVSHWREGANVTVLRVALLLTVAAPSSFSTTLVEEPAPPRTLFALVVLAVGLDLFWKRRTSRTMEIPAHRPTGGA